MYWFRRPPYLRRVAAATIVLVTLGLELRPGETVLHPFVVSDTRAGAVPELEWREVPAGLLIRPDAASGVAVHDLAAGEPLLGSDLRPGPLVPTGWWALAMEVPAQASPGTAVRLIITSPASTVEGVVVEASRTDAFGAGPPTALVAVPGDRAAAVATAVSERSVVVLLSTGGT